MILDAKEGGVVYRELVPEYLDDVRTVSEGKQSWLTVCLNLCTSRTEIRKETSRSTTTLYASNCCWSLPRSTCFASQLLSFSMGFCLLAIFLWEQQEHGFYHGVHA